MKLGNCKKDETKFALNTLINDLMLTKHLNTTINKLSGGERRLLSLATSLLSRPRILICDEPTTGLDSYNALLVVEVLKRLTMKGVAVICSIHQPSSTLFSEFNSLMLLAEGKLVFQGLLKDCKEFFESHNFHCPKNYNPSEFYIRAISADSGVFNQVERLVESFQDRSSKPSFRKNCVLPKTDFTISQRHWLKQVSLLLWRMSLSFKKDFVSQLIQLLTGVVVSGLIIGTCFYGVSGRTQTGIQNTQGLLWLLVSETVYSVSYNALYAFEGDLTLFRREVGVYSTSAFLFSRFLSYMPKCVIWPIMLVAIATVAVDFPGAAAATALEIVVALMWTAVSAAAYGLGMGALFTSTKFISEVMPTVDLPLYLVSGSYFRVSSISLWLVSVKYISHFYYGMDALTNIYWRKIDYIECPINSTSSCINDGLSFLEQSGYSNDFVFQDGLGIIGVTVLWTLLGFYGLKREERKGYVF